MTEEQRQRRALMRARSEALAAEQDDRRYELRRQEWRRDGAYLSRAELEAGESCRGCGESLLDRLGSWPPLMQLTSAEKGDHDRTEAFYRQRHGECRSHRWSISGHRATHCGYCCPPPPMSKRQIDEVRRLLSSGKADKKDLDDWDLTLTCDHVVRRSQHRDHEGCTTRVAGCPACGLHRGVVHAQRVGPTDDPEGRVHKERLATELQSATAKLERQRKAISATEDRLAELTKQLTELGTDRPRFQSQIAEPEACKA
jgi:hypothetical protein